MSNPSHPLSEVGSQRGPLSQIHPIHAFLLAGSIPLFLGVLLSDVTYSMSHEIQWKNFASWLLIGALIFSGFALLWALIDLFRVGDRSRRSIFYCLLLLASWILGFVDELVHAKDAWASMPEALIISAIAALIAAAALVLGFSTLRYRGLS